MAYGDDTVANLLRLGHPHPPDQTTRRVLELWRRLTPVQRLQLAQALCHDLETPEDDPELGAPVDRLETRAAVAAPRANALDPTALLRAHGFAVNQVTDPFYGYSGTFDPGGVFGHWTAGNGGQNVWVLEERHYHSLATRDGVAQLGGYMVRQGHGGSGRQQPCNIALNGQMTKDTMLAWQANGSGDDTDSLPNSRFMSVCLDDPGTTGTPSPAQQDCFGAMVAAFLVVLGKNLGHYIDHAASTNRKVDLGRYTPVGYSILERWYGTMTGDSGMPGAVDCAIHPNGRGAAMAYSDGRVITRDAPHFGDLLVEAPPKTGFRPEPIVPFEPVVSINWSPSGNGYLLGAADGGTFAFGDAPAHGMYSR